MSFPAIHRKLSGTGHRYLADVSISCPIEYRVLSSQTLQNYKSLLVGCILYVGSSTSYTRRSILFCTVINYLEEISKIFDLITEFMDWYRYTSFNRLSLCVLAMCVLNSYFYSHCFCNEGNSRFYHFTLITPSEFKNESISVKHYCGSIFDKERDWSLLSLTDFSKSKEVTEEKYFRDFKEVQTNMAAALNSIPNSNYKFEKKKKKCEVLTIGSISQEYQLHERLK